MKEKEKSKADMMFINLGYKKDKSMFFNYIEYTQKINNTDTQTISFEGNSQTVMVSVYSKNKFRAGSEAFTMKELKAIHEKCKELGWLDE